MELEYLNKIKARLGSLSPARLNEMVRSAQILLEEDFPAVIKALEELQSYTSTNVQPDTDLTLSSRSQKSNARRIALPAKPFPNVRYP